MTAETLLTAVRPFIDGGAVPGAVVGVLRDGEVTLDAAGTTAPDGAAPLEVDAVMRVSSNTKPMAAALTLALADDGVLSLDDPVERFVPELADRRVLRRVDAPLDDETVAAERPVTVHDLLTMRLGFGFVLEADAPAVRAAAEAGLGIGPPDPSVALSPDEWIARFAALPLLEQPGTAWRYDLSYGVLGVVLARAAGRPVDDLLNARLLAPLAMTDTGFVAPPGRLPPAFVAAGDGLALFHAAGAGSRWARAPSFPDLRGGLVSTAADLLRFASALLDGGPVLHPTAIRAMTTDQLDPRQHEGPSARTFLGGSGWGCGVQVVEPDRDARVGHRRYGWGGGLGTLWYSWPDSRVAAVLLTQVLPPSAELVATFLAAAETLVDAG